MNSAAEEKYRICPCCRSECQVKYSQVKSSSL